MYIIYTVTTALHEKGNLYPFYFIVIKKNNNKKTVQITIHATLLPDPGHFPNRNPVLHLWGVQKASPTSLLSLSQIPPLFLYIFISVPALVSGRGGPVAALQLCSTPFVSACRLSSPCPTSPLAGTVVVDGPCRRPLHFAGLIGREKFLRPDHMSKGLCLSRLRATNN